jgi:hypothetical protein
MRGRSLGGLRKVRSLEEVTEEEEKRQEVIMLKWIVICVIKLSPTYGRRVGEISCITPFLS